MTVQPTERLSRHDEQLVRALAAELVAALRGSGEPDPPATIPALRADEIFLPTEPAHLGSDGSQEPLLLTMDVAARRLEISRSKMSELVLSGTVASVKIGKLRRVPVSALTEYIDRLTAGNE